MEEKFKITIPKPCHEDWNAMMPDQRGRFCGSCMKSVVDFTNMKTSEIQEYFEENQDKKVCGRFKNEHVNKFTLRVPQSILNKRMTFRKAFLLALFVVMGTSLFSCRNNDGSTLGEVAVVNDTILQDSVKQKDTLVEKTKHEEVQSKDNSEPITTLGIVVPEVIIDSTKTENK